MPSDLHSRGAARSDAPTGREAVAWALQSAAFWIAVALPFVYLPMIALGLATAHPLWFVSLLGANALALAVGHAYDPAG